MARRSAKRIVLDKIATEWASCQALADGYHRTLKEHPLYSDTVREAETLWREAGASMETAKEIAVELGATEDEIERAMTDGTIIYVARLAQQ